MESHGKKNRRRAGTHVGSVHDLSHGMTKKFLLACGETRVEALLVNFNGDMFAYVNRCRHIAISMDWVDNQFFTEDRRYLLCANHGAVYEPATGECVWGPCGGEFLERVPLKIEDEQIYAFCPDRGESDGGRAPRRRKENG